MVEPRTDPLMVVVFRPTFPDPMLPLRVMLDKDRLPANPRAALPVTLSGPIVTAEILAIDISWAVSFAIRPIELMSRTLTWPRLSGPTLPNWFALGPMVVPKI